MMRGAPKSGCRRGLVAARGGAVRFTARCDGKIVNRPGRPVDGQVECPRSCRYSVTRPVACECVFLFVLDRSVVAERMSVILRESLA
jgi:hypothetical protein